jgi:hypothetical protein
VFVQGRIEPTKFEKDGQTEYGFDFIADVIDARYQRTRRQVRNAWPGPGVIRRTKICRTVSTSRAIAASSSTAG